MSAITVVTVCYNSTGVLPAMLESLPTGTPVILVDNASRDRNALRDIACKRGAELIELPRNMGFGQACNEGAKVARTDLILFLNPDAQLAPDTLTELGTAADRYPDAVGFNPRFVTDDGVPTFKRSSHLVPRSEWMPRGWPFTDADMPVLSGAAYLVRRADFEAVGGFDPAIFLYFEDDDLSLRLRNRGRLMFIRDAQVQHSIGAGSADDPQLEGFKRWHFGYARIYASRKHGQRFAFARTLVRNLPRALSPIVLFSRVERSERWGYLVGVTAAWLKRPNPGADAWGMGR